MEENGLSIFQGPGAIEINTEEFRRREEEDDEEEQKRRNEEINDVLKNAFEDLDNENDLNSSINSSYHRSSNFHSESSNMTGNYNDEYTNAGRLLKNNRKNSTETVITLGRMNLQNGYDDPTDRLSSESNKENFSYRCQTYQTTPANHYNKDFARKQCFNGDPENIYDRRDEEKYKIAEYHSKEQLEVLYMVRLKEIDQLSQEYRNLEALKEVERKNLERKLAIAQAEVEQTNISRNQLQNLLVNAKAEISDLKTQVTTLTENNAVLEKSKQNRTEELELARNAIDELQQKITALERVQDQQLGDKMQDKFLQQTLEKHDIEMQSMQSQIDALSNKLSQKELAYNSLEEKYNDSVRANEALLIEKGETVNKFAKALEESQIQCRNLMSNGGSSEQMCTLENKLKAVTKEKDEVLIMCKELEHKLQLVVSDSHYNLMVSKNSIPKGEQDSTNELQTELQRCLAGQAVKRKEIHRLENLISQKEQNVRHLESLLARKDNELRDSDDAIRALKQENAHYSRRGDQLEKELKSLLTDQAKKADDQIQKLADHLNEVTQRYNRLKAEKEDLEAQVQTYELQLSEIKQSTSANQDSGGIFTLSTLKDEEKERQRMQIIELTIQLDSTQKELSHVKELYIAVCGAKAKLLNEHQTELKRFRELSSSQNVSLPPDVEKLQQDLNIQLVKNTNLTEECESYKHKVEELEDKLEKEMKKTEDMTHKIHNEVDKAKKEAVEELRRSRKLKQLSAGTDQSTKKFIDQIKSAKNDLTQMEKDELFLRQEVRNIMAEKNRIEEKCETLEILVKNNQKLHDLQEKNIRDLESELRSLKRRESDVRRMYEEYQKLKSSRSDSLQGQLNDSEIRNLKEATIREVKTEMEQKVADKLKNIEAQHKRKLRTSEEKLEELIIDLRNRYEEKTQEFEKFREIVLAEKTQIASSMKAQEQIVAKMVEAKVKSFQEELIARKSLIEELQKKVVAQQVDMEEDRNIMAQVLQEWVFEVRESKKKNAELEVQLQDMKGDKEKFETQKKELEESLKKLREDLEALKKKYQSVKRAATTYKEYAKRKDEHMNSEVHRLEEDYKKSIGQLQNKIELIISNQRVEVAQQLQEIRSQYDDRLNKNLGGKKKKSLH